MQQLAWMDILLKHGPLNTSNGPSSSDYLGRVDQHINKTGHTYAATFGETQTKTPNLPLKPSIVLAW